MGTMESIRDEAIIIGRKPFGEADLLLTLLTARHGKLRVLAKGARKVTSRLVGHAELFCVIQGHMNMRSSIPILSQVTLEHSVAGLAEDTHMLQRISLLAEIVDKSLEEGAPMESVYVLLKEGTLLLRQDYQPMLFSGLMLRLLGLLGYAPELQSCVTCKVRLSADDRYGWDHAAGGILANACLDTHLIQPQLLSAETVKSLRYLQKQPIQSMGRLQVPDTVVEELTSLMINYTRYVLEQPLLSTRIFYTESPVLG